MKKKSIKVITVLLAMVMLFVSSSSVSAMSLQNTIAHRALKQQIIADKRQYCNFGMTTIKYVYADIDGDHVAELITEPGYGYLTQAIYDYQNGNVRRVATVGQGNFTKYYPKHKVIPNKDIKEDYNSNYYKYVKGTYKMAARAQKDYGNRSYDEKPVKVTYTVNDKKVTKAEYSAYVKKLIKGEKGKSFSKLKWKRY